MWELSPILLKKLVWMRNMRIAMHIVLNICSSVWNMKGTERCKNCTCKMSTMMSMIVIGNLSVLLSSKNGFVLIAQCQTLMMFVIVRCAYSYFVSCSLVFKILAWSFNILNPHKMILFFYIFSKLVLMYFSCHILFLSRYAVRIKNVSSLGLVLLNLPNSRKLSWPLTLMEVIAIKVSSSLLIIDSYTIYYRI